MYPAGTTGVTTRVIDVHGLRIRIVESGPAAGTPVLLVHGWGGCVYSFAETIPALAHAGHRVIAMDLPGHGLSEKPIGPAHYSTAALSEVVIGAARNMELGRVAYVGHSMGGLIGLHLATAQSGKHLNISRLALISSAGLTRIPVLGPIKALSPRVADRVVPRLLKRAVIAGILRAAFGTRDRPVDRDIDQYWAQTQWDEYAWACRACLHEVDFRPIPAATLRRITIPVLSITGGRDRVVGQAGKRSVLIPTARVVHIPEAGHLVMQECAPRTNAELVAFLSHGRDQ